MKQIINRPEQMVSEMVCGFQLSQPTLQKVSGVNALYQEGISKKVAVISGGGSGHEPADLGYVGTGMLDGAVMGELFTPPTVAEIVQTVQTIGCREVLFIVKNFAADVAVFEEAQQLLRKQDYVVEQVIVADDVSVETGAYALRRRGVAGTVLVQKILGAASQAGQSLLNLKALGDQVVNQVKTLGIALSPAQPPNQKTPLFTLSETEIYYGVGIHGEAGYRKEKIQSSELLANELVNKLVHQLPAPKVPLAILINGLGSTPLMELAILTQDVEQLLRLKGFSVPFVKIGEQMTSYNMAGVSLSILALTESKWLTALQAPVETMSW